MIKSYWKDGQHSIIKLVLNGKRTIQQAKNYMEANFVGDSRKAFKHTAFEATSGDIANELKVYTLLKEEERR